MEEIIKVVEKYAPHGPKELLVRLAEFRQGLSEERRHVFPRIDVHTASGDEYSGWITGVSENALLIVPATEFEGVSHDALYIALDHIKAVTIRNAMKLAPLLSDGAIPTVPGETGPSREDSREEADRILERIRNDHKLNLTVTVEWDTVPQSELGPMNAVDLLQAVHHIISNMTKMQKGREAWGRIRKLQIKHQTGSAPVSQIQGENITVMADMARALPQPLQKFLNKPLSAMQ